MNILTDNILFGIILSLIAFEVGIFIYRKSKLTVLNPLVIAMIIVICFLKFFNVSFDTFNKGGQFINMFLGPATVVLAVPLYKQLRLLKEYLIPILSGILIGTSVGIFSIISFCYILGLNGNLMTALIPKSVTTPIGVEISKNLGGLTSVTILAIVISGIIGAIVGPSLCKLFKIKNEVAIGVALGTSSHALGTTVALELGETQGAMSSLSIGIAGIMTVFLAPAFYNLFTTIFK